ncbi:MAG: hypothetical protein ACRDQA_07505 [Nocardioidaceae bacterium]
MTNDDGHTFAVPPTQAQATAVSALLDLMQHDQDCLWYPTRDQCDCAAGHNLGAVLSAAPEVLAAALGGKLAKPEDTLREWADEWEANYPTDVFIPPTPEDTERIHTALRDAGLSGTAWTAHIMRHVCAVIRRDVTILVTERDDDPAAEADFWQAHYDQAGDDAEHETDT